MLIEQLTMDGPYRFVAIVQTLDDALKLKKVVDRLNK
jgi:hypothetical protein